jgi:hypothetical protein
MSRDFQINGPTLVNVIGNSQSAFPSSTQLGLSDTPIQLRVHMEHEDIVVNAVGRSVSETQYMGGWADISMTLVHFDRNVLSACLIESYGMNSGVGGTPPGTAQLALEGTLGGAGFRLGNNLPRFGATGNATPSQQNHYIGLNFTSPIGAIPWRFLFTYLTQQPIEYPLGVEKSIIQLNWRAICYQQDPYNGGLGLQGQVLFDHGQD